MKNKPNIQTPIPLDKEGTRGTDAANARSNIGVTSTSRSINTTSPLTGGGDLSTDRTISIPRANNSNDGYLHKDDFTSFDGKEDQSNKGANNGYAGLNGNGNVPVDQGGTGANLFATGGPGQVLKQTSAGGPVSVARLTAAEMPSAIDAAKISNGAVSNTEFGYLNNVISPIQTQLNAKVRGITGGVAVNALAIWTGPNTQDYISGIGASGSTLGTPRFKVTSMPNSSGGYGVYRMPSAVGSVAQYELVWLSSNAKHKKDVATIQTTMDSLMAWRPVEFTWKEAFGGNRDLGFIADELDSVYPLAAIRDDEWKYTNEETGEYAKDENGNPVTTGKKVPMGVKYDRAWIPMLAAVQDFYRKFQDLSEEVKELRTLVGREK